MSRTVLSEFSNLLLAIYRAAQELPIDQFQDAILEAIKPHLPFDKSMWGTATMTEGGIDIHSLHLHNTTPAMIEAYQKVKHLDVAAARAVAEPTATVTFDASRDFNDPALKPYKDFLIEEEHHNIFITSDINPITRFVHWVSLYRSDPARHCTEDERELLAYIAPHVMQALAINRLVHMDRLTGDIAREKWCVAIADTKGVLYHVDRRFRELVATEWAIPSEDRLPQALLSQLLGGDDQLAGRGVVIRRNLDHGLLFLKAREREPVDSLSTREFMVARMLASGMTQKEVAAKLERSPETIRSQVKTIFDKLRINSATKLAPLLVLRS